MMKSYKIIYLFTAIIFLNSDSLFSQSSESELKFFDPNKKFSLSFYGTYISSSELQNNPKSTNPIERDATLELDGGFGFGGEINYDPGIYNLGIKFYLSSEYLKVDQTDLEFVFDDGVNQAKIRMREKFTFIPIELGVKWNLPVSTDNFKIYIGGGAGIYFGNRTREIGELKSTTINKKPGFSLNILSGLEFYIARNLSANLELKFREASFDVESKFNRSQITINGIAYQILNPFYSRIIVDGVRISLGIKYHF